MYLCISSCFILSLMMEVPAIIWSRPVLIIRQISFNTVLSCILVHTLNLHYLVLSLVTSLFCAQLSSQIRFVIKKKVSTNNATYGCTVYVCICFCFLFCLFDYGNMPAFQLTPRVGLKSLVKRRVG